MTNKCLFLCRIIMKLIKGVKIIPIVFYDVYWLNNFGDLKFRKIMIDFISGIWGL